MHLSMFVGHWQDSWGKDVQVRETPRGIRAAFRKIDGSTKKVSCCVRQLDDDVFVCGCFSVDLLRSSPSCIVWQHRYTGSICTWTPWTPEVFSSPESFKSRTPPASPPLAPLEGPADQELRMPWQAVCLECDSTFQDVPRKGSLASACNFVSLCQHRSLAHGEVPIPDMWSKSGFAMRMVQERTKRKHLQADASEAGVLLAILADHFGDEPALLVLCCAMLLEVGLAEQAALLYHTHAASVAPWMPWIPGLAAALEPEGAARSPAVLRPRADRFGPVHDGCVTLPADCEVLWVDSDAGLAAVSEALLAADVVGLDCEYSNFGASSHVSLLQAAIREQCFLVDVDALYSSTVLRDFVRSLLEGDVVKVAFQFDADLAQLQKLGDGEYNVRNMLDLHSSWPMGPSMQGGLRGIVEEALGARLCKAEQCSRWGRRPVRESQRHYAALDAWVLLPCCDFLCDRCGVSSVAALLKQEPCLGGPSPGGGERSLPGVRARRAEAHLARSVANAEVYLQRLVAEAEAELGSEVSFVVEPSGSLVKARLLLAGAEPSPAQASLAKSETNAKICCLREVLAKLGNSNAHGMPQHLHRYMRQGLARDIASGSPTDAPRDDALGGCRECAASARTQTFLGA